MILSKLARKALLAVLGGSLALTTASAAPVTYAAGELFLGFRAGGGTGATKDYLVNIGAASQFTTATAATPVVTGGAIATDLANATTLFGSGWNNRADVFWSISGTTGFSAGANGDPAKTLYATAPRLLPGTQTLPWSRESDSSQGVTNTKMRGMSEAFAGKESTANSPKAIIQTATSANSYASYQPGGTLANAGPAPGISFNAFNPSVENTFDPDRGGAAGSVLDFYRMTPGTGNGEYLGFFVIDSSASVTFYPKTTPTFSFENISFEVSEDVAGGTLTANVLRSGDTSGTVTVNVSTVAGTATSPLDFDAVSNQTLTFGPGVTTLPVTLNIKPRANFQGDRTFTLSLTLPSTGATIVGSTSASVKILETAPPSNGVITFSSATYNFSPLNGQGNPNTLTVTLNRSNATSTAVAVDVSVTGGSLAAGTDYTFTSPTTVTFGADETTKDVNIQLNTIDGSTPKTIVLGLSNATNGAVIGSTASATITVASTGSLRFSPSAYQVGEPQAGTATVTVTVQRTGGGSGAASVEVARTSGSATVTDDFTLPATPVVLNWTAGDTAAKTFDITVKSDAVAEVNGETIVLALQSATGATIGSPGTATVTILDFDVTAPTLTINSPAPNAKLAGTSVAVAGTATDNQGVGRVEVRVDGSAPVVLTPLAATTSFNWNTTLTPEPGIHFLQVTAFDVQGNATATIARSFTYSLLRAALAGSYNGLVEAVAGLANPSELNGIIAVTVTPTGTFTGKLTMSGVTLPVMGTFGVNGAAAFSPNGAATVAIIKKGKPDSTLLGYLALTIDTAGGEKITGTLKTGADAGAATLATITDAALSDPAEPKQKYTALFLADAAPNNGLPATAYPQGDGHATMAIENKGAVSIKGKLADGSVINYRTVISKSNHAPVFIPLYSKKGYIIGNVIFDTAPVQTDASAPNMRWFKPAGLPAQKNYPNGWPRGITVDFVASKFAPPASGATVLGANSGAALEIDLTDGGLAATVNVDATITAPATIAITGANPQTVKVSLISATGALSGSFIHPGNTKSASFSGVVLQKSKSAGGFFLYTPATGQPAVSGAVSIVLD